MALIKCTECGQTISDRASMCPNCGCPVEGNPSETTKRTTSSNKKWVLLIVSLIVLIVASVIVYIVLPKGSEPLYSDLEILGFDKDVKRINIFSESEQHWECLFDEDGMLTECVVADECGPITYVFDDGKLISAIAEYGGDMCDGEERTEEYKYVYQKEGKDHTVCYETDVDGSGERKFADICYDKQGRVIEVEHYAKTTINYGVDNKPFNQEGRYIVVALELVGVPTINAKDFRTKVSELGDIYLLDEERWLSIEIEK